MTRPSTGQAVALASQPDGVPVPEDFRCIEVEVPSPAPGQVLVRVGDLSLDPYLRSLLGGRHLDDAPVEVGEVIPGRAVAQVIESDHDAVPVGSWVLAETGWRSHAAVDVAAATPVSVPDGVARSAVLGALGMPGLTAYAALERHLRPRIGDTVVISSATGGVGAVAGQLAALAGARPVAIVGSAEKARTATESLGYAAAVLRTDPDWAEQLRAACPDGVDAYLHMGDQATIDGVLEQLAVGARVSLCGVMDQTNGAAPTRVRAGAVMAARAVLHGMVVYDHADLTARHQRVVGDLLAAGRLRIHEDRYHGLEQAGYAFSRLMAGLNQGKVVVEVSKESQA